MQRYYRLAGVCLLLLSFVFPTTAFSNDTRAVNTDKDQLVLGLLPIVSPERLTRRFAPLAKHLTGKVGVDVVIETAPSYREFAMRTNRETRFGILFTAPHLYYLAQREGNYRVVVRVAGPPMNAVIVVPKSSRIMDLNDLRGHTLATPASLSLGTMLIHERLAEAGNGLSAMITLVETPTHNASVLSAINNSTDAAGLMTPVFNRLSHETKSRVRLIANTASTPHMPFSVAPWIPAHLSEAFANAMIETKNTPEGRALLKHLGWPGFVTAQPQDYDFFDKFAAAIDLK